jgi:hypothetical protein
MPELGSVMSAVGRMADFVAVNEKRSVRKKTEAVATLNELLGVSPETLQFITYVATNSDLSDGVPIAKACSLIVWGMVVALAAVQLETDGDFLRAAE